MKGEVSLIQVSIRELEGLPFKKANDSWGKDWSASSSSHLSFISAKNQLLGRAGSNPGLGVCPYQLAWGLPETQDSEVTFPKPSYLQKRPQLLLPGNKKSIHLLGQDDEVAMPSVCQFRWLLEPIGRNNAFCYCTRWIYSKNVLSTSHHGTCVVDGQRSKAQGVISHTAKKLFSCLSNLLGPF